MADFIYNPAESIRQGFQQAQSGLGSIFAQVIAQQQRDYNLAESAFQNIEALKKDVNIFGMKNITNKSNQLLDAASSAIKKDGSIDYEKIGQIRQSISEIKDLKTGYDLGAKELERRLQLGIANKDNMDSFENYYKQLMGVMADENLVKNPQDLMTKFSEVYDNNLSAAKMYQKSFLSANPYKKFQKDIDVDGNLIRIGGEIRGNMMIDASGKVVPKPPVSVQLPNGQTAYKDYVDLEVERLKATDPDGLARMKRQLGVGGQFYSDYDVVKTYIDKIPDDVKEMQVKSADERRKEKGLADTAEAQGERADEIVNATLNAQRASAAVSWNTAKYYKNKAEQEEVQMSYDPFQDFSKTSITGGSTGNKINLTKYPLGKEFTLGVNGQQAIIKSIARDEKGQVWVEALKGRDGKFTMDKNNRRAAFQFHLIKDFNTFNTELAREIQVGNGIPTKQQAKMAKAIGTLYNLPAATPAAPAGRPASGRGTGVAVPASEF